MVSKATIHRRIKQWFGGHPTYKKSCNDGTVQVMLEMMWGERRPEHVLQLLRDPDCEGSEDAVAE
jgi:hypothetical protein